MRIRLLYVQAFTDRHGTRRHYLRRPGHPTIKLPGEPGSPEFLAAYQAGMTEAKPAPRGPIEGSLDHVAMAYYGSHAFKSLRATSQTNYRRIIERLRAEHGGKPVKLLNAVAVHHILDKRADHPAARNHLLRCLRALMRQAIAMGIRADDPTAGITKARYEVRGYRPWTDAEIEQYEAHHRSGTKARLAFALLLHTGQRRSDIVRLGRQHLSGGVLTFRQVKTGAAVSIPLHPELEREIAAAPAGQLTFLANKQGKPHSAGGFYNLFVAWCAEAGLPPGLAPHGMRKATLRQMAESGATEHEIMSVSGHRSSQEIRTYTEAADRARLAKAGLAKVTAMRARGKS